MITTLIVITCLCALALFCVWPSRQVTFSLSSFLQSLSAPASAGLQVAGVNYFNYLLLLRALLLRPVLRPDRLNYGSTRPVQDHSFDMGLGQGPIGILFVDGKHVLPRSGYATRAGSREHARHRA